MVQNDFLKDFFALPLYQVFLITFAVGFALLLLVGGRTKSFKFLISNPAFLIGDLIILPILSLFITYFYTIVQSPLSITTSSFWTITTALLSFLITITAGIHYRMLNIWWIPHGIFFFLFTYIVVTFVSKAFTHLLFIQSDLFLWGIFFIVLIGITTHQFLGYFWPKKLPL